MSLSISEMESLRDRHPDEAFNKWIYHVCGGLKPFEILKILTSYMIPSKRTGYMDLMVIKSVLQKYADIGVFEPYNFIHIKHTNIRFLSTEDDGVIILPTDEDTGEPVVPKHILDSIDPNNTIKYLFKLKNTSQIPYNKLEYTFDIDKY